LLQIVDYIVGWVEVTKPFDFAVPERSPCSSTPLTGREVEG